MGIMMTPIEECICRAPFDRKNMAIIKIYKDYADIQFYRKPVAEHDEPKILPTCKAKVFRAGLVVRQDAQLVSDRLMELAVCATQRKIRRWAA